MLLDLECPDHGQVLTDHLVKSHKDLPNCPICNKPTRRLWGVGSLHVFVDFYPGYDRAVEKYFYTKRERDNYLAEHDLRKIRS